MKPGSYWLTVTIAIILSTFSSTGLHALAARQQTFTGQVGDAMCGRKHMEGTPASCTRTCISQGSRYMLITDDSIYILKTTDPKALNMLDKKAGQIATVTGTLNGDMIDVRSVAAK
jgi:hypothetical protein